jgi:23S rRNA pseudouridine1911/1915/1917 synthase
MSSTEGAPDSIEVLLLDEHLCAVWKPAGMPVQPDHTGDPSLLDRVSQQIDDPRLALVHRLDRPVSGVVLFARSSLATKALNEQFRDRRVEKRYWAIVEGTPVVPEGQEWTTIEHLLLHDTKAKRSKVLHSFRDGAAMARLKFKILGGGERLSLLEVVPEGGAFHQIRAQLSAMGHSIRGDVKYGARRSEKDRSIALHARSLVFQHPSTLETVRVEADAPQSSVWNALLAIVPKSPSQEHG